MICSSDEKNGKKGNADIHGFVEAVNLRMCVDATCVDPALTREGSLNRPRD